MKALLFGATGMVGQGVLRECLLDPDLQMVVAIGRSSSRVQNSKLLEIVHGDLCHYADIENKLAGFDACFFCLGVSSSGMAEEAYTRVTYDIALAAARNFVPA
jgi:putative NADH-flavin reductase